ncbi:Cbl proto-oncogene [Rhinolophus ferrumequinum]|uniref:Cbl proto-oncogene n=1 Tax=Rhinolophus ferrumequinum TaxID=59479 RepID=A0A7J7W5V3_RHIFE|nr:Cbl proto-oncogene [Rhinolophus ferrumequinum]
MWLTTPSVCTEQRLKANLRSADWAAEQISRVLIAWPHILDSVPKMNVRCPPHCLSQVLLLPLNQTGRPEEDCSIHATCNSSGLAPPPCSGPAVGCTLCPSPALLCVC